MTYYDILGVTKTASAGDIRRAYLKLVQDFHPDKLMGVSPAVRKLAEEKFKDVQEAYEILTKHRAEYDNQLRVVAPTPPPPVQPKPQATAPPPPPAPRPSQKANKDIWYACGRICSLLPWQGWIAIFSMLITAVILWPSNTPDTNPQAPSTVTQQAPPSNTLAQAAPDKAVKHEISNPDKQAKQVFPAEIIFSNPNAAMKGDKKIIEGYEYGFDGQNWIRGEKVQSLIVSPTPVPTPQKLRQTASNTPVPLTNDEVVYYADDWQKVHGECLLFTGRSDVVDGAPIDISGERMICGRLASAINTEQTDEGPGIIGFRGDQNFKARIVLDQSAINRFKNPSQWGVRLSCEEELEANGDLHCTGKVTASKTVQEEVVPKPVPKYVALGIIRCYANQRVNLYTDETLAKTTIQLGLGQYIYKVGIIGNNVGLSLRYESTPAYWLDGKDIDKLTCEK